MPTRCEMSLRLSGIRTETTVSEVRMHHFFAGSIWTVFQQTQKCSHELGSVGEVAKYDGRSSESDGSFFASCKYKHHNPVFTFINIVCLLLLKQVISLSVIHLFQRKWQLDARWKGSLLLPLSITVITTETWSSAHSAWLVLLFRFDSSCWRR